MKKNGLSHIPVISFNLNGMEKNPGFIITPGMLVQLIYAVLYGDILMLLSNQTRPYEVEQGASDNLTNKWIRQLSRELRGSSFLNTKKVKKRMEQIAADFAAVPVKKTDKVKVGIVGEIYMKYSPLGNNNLEDFLQQEDAEVEVPGLLDFIIYTCDNGATDARLYGINRGTSILSSILKNYLVKMQNLLIEAVRSQPCFRAPLLMTISNHWSRDISEQESRWERAGCLQRKCWI